MYFNYIASKLRYIGGGEEAFMMQFCTVEMTHYILTVLQTLCCGGGWDSSRKVECLNGM